MTAPLIPPKRVRLHFDIATDDQAAELSAAWQEIISGKRARLNTTAEELNELMERAMAGLQRIVQAIEAHPGTGQTGRLVSFLAGLYNGSDYPFDLTDLRALDTELATACVDYLNYDRLAKAEVHTHLPGGGRQMEWFMAQHRIRPRLRLSSYEEHESRLHALAEQLDREPDAILKDALYDLLARHEGKAFGELLASQQSPDEDRPLGHARDLSDSVAKPLCGATDGPWSARGFDFLRLTCHECQTLVLDPKRASARLLGARKT
jgi:hypothetical protein